MEFDKEALKNIKKNIVKNVNELGKKTDLTAAETKAMLDGFDAYDRACCELENCEMVEQAEGDAKKNSYRGYSMHGDTPYRRYNITAYGDPAMASYGRPRMPHYSGDYGVQGWYRSGDDRMYQAGVYPMDHFEHNANGSYGNYPMANNMSAAEHREYSRHSVNDRVISIIEKSPELNGMSPFEQDEVRRIMALIRTAE